MLTSTKWDVITTVEVDIAGEVRRAKAGEVECKIEDIGEVLDFTVYNQTGWIKCDANGQVRFKQSVYGWLTGWDGFLGPNRFIARARIVGLPETMVDIFFWLHREKWSAEGSSGASTAFPGGSEW